MSSNREAKILFVEDDKAGREVGIYNLTKAGYEVDGASDGESGLELFFSGDYDLVITDVKMPGISGMEVLAKIQEKSADTPVLVITAFADVDLAVSAMKAGAYDFIGKPFNRDQLLLSIKRALANRDLRQEVKNLRIRANGVERDIVYGSEKMERVLEMTDKIASSDAIALITGESGTGKELIARRLHVRSERAPHPFVAVNAAAMPAELLESELFGHEKGAFTGATKQRVGRFRQADKGTLFLDEIAELPLQLQTKLLRVLQEQMVDVVGADEPVKVNVRVIAATNRDLSAEVKNGRFREDLFYRLNVVEIHVPPLRERIEDIEPLATHFISNYSGGRELIVPKNVLDRLQSYQWPGNVRELENACHRLAILSSGNEVSEGDLPFDDRSASDRDSEDREALFEDWPPLPKEGLSLMDLESRVIERVLRHVDGNVSKAAVYLGIPRHVLAYRMQKYGIRQ